MPTTQHSVRGSRRAKSEPHLTPKVAHELNQPLTAVLNYIGALEVLLGQDVGPSAQSLARAREGLRLAHEQAQRACEIVRRLRGYDA